MSKPAPAKKPVVAEKPEDNTVANTDVLTKYKAAADITNRVLAEIVAGCVDGASVFELCVKGDEAVKEAAQKVYKADKKMSKGVGFPTCISINNVVCNFSPSSAEGDVKLKNGDMVKVELGAQIDGFGAIAATTAVVGASKENPVKGKQADVLLAAYNAAEAAVRLLKVGNTNMMVTDHVGRIAAAYGCKPAEGTSSYLQEKNVIDGSKNILLNPNEAQRQGYNKATFAENEVYCIDIIVSSGTGKSKASSTRTTVYKKTAATYQLKMATSRSVYSEIAKKFGSFPFNIRHMDEERKARMGLIEAVKHQAVNAFEVEEEEKGEFVAQFLFTACVMPSGTSRITSTPIDLELIQSEKKIEDEEINKLLASEIRPKKKKANKKKEGEAAEEKKDA